MKSSEELNQASHEGNSKPAATRFVEELADENDYWMSLTDAARVTRTSEPMVRRWATTGRLPVKKEPVGINQRTRLVRASDVALIRPIIDPTAAITDDIHKLDLLSIPRQQEQIMHDHQRVLNIIQELQQQITDHALQTRIALEQEATALQQQAQEWNQRFAAQQANWQEALNKQQQWYKEIALQVDAQIQVLQQQTRELKELGTQQQQAITGITGQLEGSDATLQELQRHLEELNREIRLQVDQISSDFTTRLNQQEMRSQNLFGEIKETLAYRDKVHQQMCQDLANVQLEVSTLQETLLARIKQQRSEIDAVLQQHRDEMQLERTTRHEYMKSTDLRLSAMEIQDQANQKAWTAYQEHDKDQERQIQLLTAQLHEERTARQTLSEQFTQQQEMLQSLCRKLE